MSEAQRNIDSLWAEARPDRDGLVPCVVQDLRTHGVLMLAWVSKEALAKTLDTGFAWFWSRSRRELWQKGATSGHIQRIVQVRLDCDGDTLVYLVEAQLPACHEGTDTCFSRRYDSGAWAREAEALEARGDVLQDLETVIAARAAGGPGEPPSYTRKLLEGGIPKQVAKIREEAEELAVAFERETDERVVSECADLLYHMAVALKGRGLAFSAVFQELGRRFSRSGIEEKASRPQKPEGAKDGH